MVLVRLLDLSWTQIVSESGLNRLLVAPVHEKKFRIEWRLVSKSVFIVPGGVPIMKRTVSVQVVVILALVCAFLVPGTQKASAFSGVTFRQSTSGPQLNAPL